MSGSQKYKPGELPSLKISVIGSAGTGKTALIKRYVEDASPFSDDCRSRATIGVDLFQKKLSAHGDSYQLYLLDTAGQERFRTLSSSFYRNTLGVIIVFDVTNRASFSQVTSWFTEAQQNTFQGVVKYLVGNKTDKADRTVTEKEAKELAEALNIGYCEVSAGTGFNVKRPFVDVVQAIVSSAELVDRAKGSSGPRTIVNLGSDGAEVPVSGCWC